MASGLRFECQPGCTECCRQKGFVYLTEADMARAARAAGGTTGTVRIKRAYEEAEPTDGYRVLVDRLYPRGVRKDALALDAWMKEIGPSDELRRWFGHRAERFEEFARRYTDELRDRADPISALRRRARTGTVTIVYAARDADHSNAAVLARLVRRGFPAR